MSDQNKRFSRRDFLKLTGTSVIGFGLSCSTAPMVFADGTAVIPASEGYLLVDSKKCAGCMSCMLACSLVHEGKENLSFARIQVIQFPFDPYPNDIALSQCRQCIAPDCVEACPTGALHADQNFGNIRTVNAEKCIGCRDCIDACPFTPGKAIWNFETDKAQKCDLCAQARFWKPKGGPQGKQACVEVCPMDAIRFSRDVPNQTGDNGYDVDLRTSVWKQLGFLPNGVKSVE